MNNSSPMSESAAGHDSASRQENAFATGLLADWPPVVTPPSEEASLTDRMQSLLQGLQPDNVVTESRRREQRYPYPCLLRVIPWSDDDSFDASTSFAACEHESMTVVGRHLSLHGIGFFHQQPIADRLVLIELPDATSAMPLRVIVKLSRCRFAREGWYESGGRLIGKIG